MCTGICCSHTSALQGADPFKASGHQASGSHSWTGPRLKGVAVNGSLMSYSFSIRVAFYGILNIDLYPAHIIIPSIIVARHLPKRIPILQANSSVASSAAIRGASVSSPDATCANMDKLPGPSSLSSLLATHPSPVAAHLQVARLWPLARRRLPCREWLVSRRSWFVVRPSRQAGLSPWPVRDTRLYRARRADIPATRTGQGQDTSRAEVSDI